MFSNFLIIHVMLSLQVVVQRTTQENVVRGQDCRVGGGLVIFFMGAYSYKGMHFNFLVFHYSCQEFTIVYMGKKFMYNTCLIPKDCSNDFSCWWHILWISSYFGICASSPSIAAWIQLYNGWHRFHSLWHFVTGNPHFWFCGDAKDQRLLPPCVFVHIHQCTDLVIAKLFQ